MKLLFASWILFSAVPTCPALAQMELSTEILDLRIPAASRDSLLFQPMVAARLPLPAWHEMVTNLPGDWYHFGGQVFSERSLPALGGIAVTTGLLLAMDPMLYRASKNVFGESRHGGIANDIIVHFGDGRSTLAFAAGFGLYGLIAGDSRALRTASQTAEALVASGVVVQLLKRTCGRESPQVASSSRGDWRPFPSWKAYDHHQAKYYAFPSGHVTTLMATVTVVAENYPEAGWIKPVGYSLIGALGVALVGRGWHWFSDYPIAVALGYSFGKLAAHPGGEGETGGALLPQKDGISFSPFASEIAMGMSMQYSF